MLLGSTVHQKSADQQWSGPPQAWRKPERHWGQEQREAERERAGGGDSGRGGRERKASTDTTNPKRRLATSSAGVCQQRGQHRRAGRASTASQRCECPFETAPWTRHSGPTTRPVHCDGRRFRKQSSRLPAWGVTSQCGCGRVHDTVDAGCMVRCCPRRQRTPRHVRPAAGSAAPHASR